MPEDHAHQPTNLPPLERSKSLIERWPCEVEKCRNHGQICYWTISDTADNHLPVTSIILQYWLAAIARRECTIDVPPPQVIEQWQRQNLRTLQDRVKRRERQAERMAARDSSSPRLAFWRFKQKSQPSSSQDSVKATTKRPEEAADDSAGMDVG